jgi:hypothetical protein
LSTLAQAVLRGAHSSRPTDNSTGTEGRLYYETDTYKLFRDNGTSWDDCEASISTSVARSGSTTDAHLAVWNGSDADSIKDGGAVPSAGTARSGSTTDAHYAVWNGSNADSLKDGGAALTVGTVVRDKLFDTTLGSAGTFDYNNIPATYDHLEVIITNARSAAAGDSDNMRMAFNADTTAGNYRYQWRAAYASSTGAYNGADYYLGDCAGNGSPANAPTFTRIQIGGYAGTAYLKCAMYQTTFQRNTSNYLYIEDGALQWGSTNAITRITISTGSGNFLAGARCQIWGVKQTA